MTDTAEALIEAAASRFATEGIERASLRGVMRDAGTDPGAVHYHFGSREALAAAVLDRILAPLNARRLSLLDVAQADAGAEPMPLPRLVEALIRPDIETATELRRRGDGRARLIAEIYLHPAAFVEAAVNRHFSPVAARFQPLLSDAVPAVPAEVLGWRVRWTVFGTIGALLAHPTEPFATSADEVVDRLVATLSGALAAPPR